MSKPVDLDAARKRKAEEKRKRQESEALQRILERAKKVEW